MLKRYFIAVILIVLVAVVYSNKAYAININNAYNENNNDNVNTNSQSQFQTQANNQSVNTFVNSSPVLPPIQSAPIPATSAPLNIQPNNVPLASPIYNTPLGINQLPSTGASAFSIFSLFFLLPTAFMLRKLSLSYFIKTYR